MWELIGQPTRSGYNYDDLDDAPKTEPSTLSDVLMLPAIIVFTILLPFILLIMATIQLLSKALGIPQRSESRKNRA